MLYHGVHKYLLMRSFGKPCSSNRQFRYTMDVNAMETSRVKKQVSMIPPLLMRFCLASPLMANVSLK